MNKKIKKVLKKHRRKEKKRKAKRHALQGGEYRTVPQKKSEPAG